VGDPDLTWTPSDLVVDGQYCPLAVVLDRVQAAARATGYPFVYAVFDRGRVVSTLSTIVDADGRFRPVRYDDSPVADAAPNEELVAWIRHHATQEPLEVEVLAGPPRRSGDLGIVIGRPAGEPISAADRRSLVEATLGSFIAVAHRENSLGGQLRSLIRSAALSRPLLGSPEAALAHQTETQHQLLRLSRDFIEGVEEVAAYSRVDDGIVMTGTSERRSPVLLPEEVREVVARRPREGVALHAPAEYAKFDSYSEAIMTAVASSRRTLGFVGDDHMRRPILVQPYDEDFVSVGRADGAIALLGKPSTLPAVSLFGPYELSLARNLALRFGLKAAESRWTGMSRRLSELTRELSKRLGSDSRTWLRAADHEMRSNPRPATMAAELHDRVDVHLVDGFVELALEELRRASRSASATFRLVIGSGPMPDRLLARVRASPESAAVSPDCLPSCDPDGTAPNVHAWVARHGAPCSLRAIGPLGRSADLERYGQLERAKIYREGVRSELCVPVFAEGRLVGTINLESNEEMGFEGIDLLCEEFAQVIGLALVLVRRAIGIGVLEDTGLALRHHSLRMAKDTLKAWLRRAEHGMAPTADDVRALVGGMDLTRVGSITWEADVVAAPVPLDEVLDAHLPPDLPTERTFAEDLVLSGEAAHALAEALRQVVDNLGTYKRSISDKLGRRVSPSSALVRRYRQGGKSYADVRITNYAEDTASLRTRVASAFRSPIQGADGELRLGLFIAGEDLRRVGGAGYLAIDDAAPVEEDVVRVTVCLSVPVLDDPVATPEPAVVHDDALRDDRCPVSGAASSGGGWGGRSGAGSRGPSPAGGARSATARCRRPGRGRGRRRGRRASGRRPGGRRRRRPRPRGPTSRRWRPSGPPPPPTRARRSPAGAGGPGRPASASRC
jgi:hypothetical protein